eukprot:606801-Pelagomonas_calceolata.AAC.2
MAPKNALPLADDAGQPLPEDMVNPSVSFLWMVNGSAQLQDALRNISESELTDERFGDEVRTLACGLLCCDRHGQKTVELQAAEVRA